MPVEQSTEIVLPNPASFIVQKLLIHKNRLADKKAQDVLYIHDTLEVFGASLDELKSIWEGRIRPTMPGKTAKRAVTTARDLFENVTDTIRTAALIPADRILQPENVCRAINYGLNEIFGTEG